MTEQMTPLRRRMLDDMTSRTLAILVDKVEVRFVEDCRSERSRDAAI